MGETRTNSIGGAAHRPTFYTIPEPPGRWMLTGTES